MYTSAITKDKCRIFFKPTNVIKNLSEVVDVVVVNGQNYIDVDWIELDVVLHNTAGPAVVLQNGGKAWYIDGMLHREDGPALVSYLNNHHDWYLNGIMYSFNKFIAMTSASDDIKAALILEYG